MAELPLDQGIPRFKTNEERFHDFVNGSTGDTFETSEGVEVPSIRKFLNDKSGEINAAGNSILGQATQQAQNAADSADDAAQSAAAAAASAEAVGLFDPNNYYTKSVIDNGFYTKTAADARYYTQTYINSTIVADIAALQAKATSLTSLVSNLRSNVSSMALVVADLDGRRLGMANSVADAFDDTTGVLLQSGGNDVNTISLLHFDGANNSTTITDSASSPRKYVVRGDAKIVTNQSKFGGSSAYFDGTGDGIQGDGNPAFAFGTGDFTIDLWLRIDTTIAARYFVDFSGGTNTYGLAVQYTSAGKIAVYVGTALLVTCATSMVANTWYHIALVRSGTNFRVYLNGVLDGSATNNNAFIVGGNGPAIGIYGDYAYAPHLGWIDEFRVSNIARWSANFAPPTAPYTVDTGQSQNVIYSESNDWFTPTVEPSNVASLIHADGANNTNPIIDATGLRSWAAGGNAVISTAQSKFGGSSMAFDGSGDYYRQVPVAPYADLAFGVGDYTVDCWLRINNTTQNNPIWDSRSASTNNNPTAFVSAGGTVSVYIGAATRITSTTVLAINTWYHVAVVRSGAVTRLYINGVQEGVSYTDTNVWVPQSSGFTIGANLDASASLNGFIDEFRISGVARWTGNFSPPTAPYDLPKSNIVITSVTYTAASAPTTGRMVIQTIETDAIVINTDLIGEISRDGGVTYTAATLALASDLGGVKVYEGMADISGQPNGTSMKWRIRTANNKNVTVSGAVLQWS